MTKVMAGMDLHSNNVMIGIIDQQGKRLEHRKLGCELNAIAGYLDGFKARLRSLAVESTFNWYWLVDGLQAHGYCLQLVNTAAVTQYDGLKYSGDHHDAFHLAHLLRLGILPTGHIYPKEQRAIRDLLRRRLSLVRAASTQLISVQSQRWRCTGMRVKSERLRRADFEPPQMDSYTLQAVQAGLAVYHAMQAEIDVLEQSAHQAVKLSKEFEILQTIRGIGKILGLTIMLETGDIHRFASAGKFASYCRCVDSLRTSNGKKKGSGNVKAGNPYLSRAFSEAAHFAVRYEPLAQRFLNERKRERMASLLFGRLRASWQ